MQPSGKHVSNAYVIVDQVDNEARETVTCIIVGRK